MLALLIKQLSPFSQMLPFPKKKNTIIKDTNYHKNNSKKNMKIKHALSILICTLFLQTGFAQKIKTTYPFWEASVGMGLLPTFIKDKSLTDVPPLMAGIDYRINKKLSVGLFAGHTKVETGINMVGDNRPERFQNNFSMIGLRFAIHSTYFEKWDLYGGMSYAYTISNIDVIEGDIEELKQHKNFKSLSGKMMTSAFVRRL